MGSLIRHFLAAALSLLCAAATPVRAPETPDLYRLALAARAEGRVMTVSGPIDPRLLGPTLMHEHLFVDWFEGFPPASAPDRVAPAVVRRMQESGWPVPRAPDERRFFNAGRLTLAMIDDLRGNRRLRTNYVIDDDALVARETAAFAARGGRTIVDLTPRGLGRDTGRLKRFAERSGLNVVTGTGWYRWPFHPPALRRMSVDRLTRILVEDVVRGGPDGVRAGIIGEIPVDSRSIRIDRPIGEILPDALVDERSKAPRRRLLATPVARRDLIPPGEIADGEELKVLRAAARASRLTGAALSIHGTEPWIGYLRIVEGEGADLGRVVISHAHYIFGERALLEAALRKGVVLEEDYNLQHYATRAPVSDIEPALDGIAWAILHGYRDQILLSLDICNKLGLKEYGGGGYDTLHQYILPRLKARGISTADIDHILVDNPRRLLTLVAPRRPAGRAE
jgi:phosphotriesterase-related protein